MKNSLSQKLLATILSAALLLNGSSMAFAADEGIPGADGTPIVTASETVTTTEETPPVDEEPPTTEEEPAPSAEEEPAPPTEEEPAPPAENGAPPAENGAGGSGEQGEFSDPKGSESVLPEEDANAPVCDCGAIADASGVITHGVDCQLYTEPEQTEKTECTCDAQADADSVTTHGEECPLYVAPPLMMTPMATADYAIIIEVNGTNAGGGDNLEAAVTASKVAVNDITSLKITVGEVTQADWHYFAGSNAGSNTLDTKPLFTALKTFTVAPAVTSVANIPNKNANLFPMSITSVTIPQEIQVGSNAFLKCEALISVDLPAATRIGDYAFRYCTALTSVSLPKVAYINNFAFGSCTALATLKLPASPPKVGDVNIFHGCPTTTQFVFVDANGKDLADNALATAQKAYDDVTDHGNVANDGLWYDVKVREAPKIAIEVNETISASGDNLKEAVAAAVKVIGAGVSNDAIKTLTITAGTVTTADWDALRTTLGGDNSTLKTFEIADDPAVTSVANTPTFGSPSTLFPASITSITIPQKITVGIRSFTRYAALATVNLPKATAIGDSAFSSCPALTSVSLPEATEIGASAFQSCKALATVSLPKVETIGSQAFSSCPALVTMELPAAPPKVPNFNVFYDIKTKPLVIVDENGKELGGKALADAIVAYKAVDDTATGGIEVASDDTWYGWKLPAAPELPKITIEVSDGTTTKTAGGATLAAAVTASGLTSTTITSLTITKGEVTDADWGKLEDALGGTSSTLKTFEIAEGVTVADTPEKTSSLSIFPSSITSVTIPQPIVVNEYAFTHCRNLTTVSLPAAKSIGKNAFDACEKLTNVTLSAATSIGEWAFDQCETLAKIELPAATFIGKNAFSECELLAEVKLPVAEHIGERAFWQCKALAEIDLPEATSIDKYAFQNCTMLASVRLPKAETIDKAFVRCESLATLKLGAIPPTLLGNNSSAFSDCPKTNPLVIVGADGNALPDDALTNAQKAYDEVADGMTGSTATDGKWHGWKVRDPIGYQPSNGGVTFEDGNIYANGNALTVVKGSSGTRTNIYYTDDPDKTPIDLSKVCMPNDRFASIENGFLLSWWSDGPGAIGPILFGGSKTESVDSVKLNLEGGELLKVYGSGGDATTQSPSTASVHNITINASGIFLNSGIMAVGYNGKVTGRVTVNVTGGNISNLRGYSWYGQVDGRTSTTLTGGEFSSVYVPPTLSIGGGVKILALGDSYEGVIIKGGTRTKGVDTFAISSPLQNEVNVHLPEGYTGGTIATGAVTGDLAKIKLTGKGATGANLKLENGNIVVTYGDTPTVPVTGVSLNKTALSLEAGKSETLTATIAPATATNKAVTWTSSNAAIATVDENGKITAVAVGSATITVTTTDGGKTATCAVTVTAAVAKPAPGGTLEAPLTQDKVDGVFGAGNATLDGNKITINNNIIVDNTIIVKPSPITIDLGGNTVTGGAGANPVVKVDNSGTGTITGGGSINGSQGGAGVEVGGGSTVTVGGGTVINGGDSSTGNGGNGITGGTDSDITIGGGTTVEGGDGANGGDGINTGGNVTVDGTVNGGNGSSGNGGDGVDTSGGAGNITINPDGSATGGESTGGGNGGNGTVSGGGNITVDGESTGGNGGASTDAAGGNGGDGSASTGGGNITVGGDTTGGNGGNGVTGGNGGDGISTDGNTTVNGGSSTGGTGGAGSTTDGNGGDGGNGITGGTGSDITIGDGTTVEGGNGATGGDGIHTGGNVTVDGTVNGGNGSSGNGGDGVDTSGGSGSITIKPDGSATGGESTGGNGNGGDGSASTGGGNITVGGDTTGGNGGNGVTGGNGGDGISTDGNTTVNGGSSTGGTGGAGSTTDGNGGDGGNGITGGINGGTGSDITIGGGTTVEGGDGANGGDGINTGGNVTVDGTVNGGNGSSGNGGDGVDTSGGAGSITIKPDGSATGGSSTGGDGNGGDGTVSGGGNITVEGESTGGNGGASTDAAGGNGGNGATTDNGNITVGGDGSTGTVTGGNGGDGATGGAGGSGSTSTGSGSVDINAGSGATGGNGGSGSTGAGGTGGNGATTEDGNITVDGSTTGGTDGTTTGGAGGSGSTTGGDGGDGSASTGNGSIEVGGGSTGGNGGNGATGGTGGNGTSTGGNTTVNGGGSSTGGTGGSGSISGGNGGNGTDTSGTNTTIDGGANGGHGGSGTSGSNGAGGDGGAGANQNGGTVNGSGTATGGNGGSGSGSGGAGGAGVGGGANPSESLITKDGISAKVVIEGTAQTEVKLPDPAQTVDAVLTPEEKKDKHITEVKVTLKVDDKTNNKPADAGKAEDAKPVNSFIGAFFDITLQKTIKKNDVEQPPVTLTDIPNNATITITIEIPVGMRGGSNYAVIRVHGDAAQKLTTTKDGNELTFATDKFSTYAIAYTKNVTPPTPPSDNTSGGGDSSSNDDEYDFWMDVNKEIEKTDVDNVIKVNAKDYDKIPESMMETLRKDGKISLVITWNGGTITIPSGKAPSKEKGRIYWPLSLLAEMYADVKLVEAPKDSWANPETGGVGYIEYADGKQIPITGGKIITMQAPDSIGNTQPRAITPPTAGFEADAFAGTEDAKQANSGNVFAVIALMLAAVAVGSGVWFWKKRQEVQ